MLDPKEIENRFAFHPATTPEKRGDHSSVRTRCLELALFLNDKLPGVREAATALTKLEECMFWANAALAREDTRDHRHIMGNAQASPPQTPRSRENG